MSRIIKVSAANPKPINQELADDKERKKPVERVLISALNRHDRRAMKKHNRRDA